MRQGQLDQIVRKIDSLPSLPAIATRLLEITLSDKASAMEISELLSLDPALSAKVLKVVNSAAFGLRFPVSSLGYAITVLGLQRIRTLVLSLSIFDTFSKMGKRGKLDPMSFWKHSVASAAAARSLAAAMGDCDPEEAYVAGLTHDLGMLILDRLFPKEYAKIVASFSQGRGSKLTELEKACFGFDHSEIGAKLAEKWKFPYSLQAALRYHHTPEEAVNPEDPATQNLVALIASADYLAWCASYPPIETVEAPNPSVAVLDRIHNLDIQAQLDLIHQEVEQGSEVFRYSDETGERWMRAVLQANVELGRISAQMELANRGLISLNTALLNTQHRLGEHNPIDSLLAEVVGTLGYDRAFLLRSTEPSRYELVQEMNNDGTSNLRKGLQVELPTQLPWFSGLGIRLRNSEGSDPAVQKLLESLGSLEIVLAPILEGRSFHYVLGADRAISKQEIPSRAEEALACLTSQAGLLLENYRLYQTVKDMSVTDPLTGVCNRRRLMEVLSEEADRATRTRQPFSVAILDIDHFKKLNDKLGHLAGDQILKKVGELLRNSIRQGDLVGRYGGEEFLIVLPGADTAKAGIAAERMRKGIEQLGKAEQNLLKGSALTASLGVAELQLDQENYEGMLGRADKALYQAKENGRNQVQFSANFSQGPS